MAKTETLSVAGLVLKTKILHAFFAEVTSLQAKFWLENHNHVNRKKRIGTIEKYIRDRGNNLWLTTHEAVAFDWNGELVDGQHRLEMISQSGQSIKTLIVLGLDPEVRMVVDTGIPRHPHDVLKLLGYDATPWDVAIVRQMMSSIFPRRPTMSEIVHAYKKHEKKAKIICDMFPTKKRHVTMSPVLAPMARALETYDENLIQQFADILYSGMSRGRKRDQGTIILRDYLVQLRMRGGSLDREIYRITESALHAFLNNEHLTNLEPTNKELFPMRGEAKLKLVEDAE